MFNQFSIIQRYYPEVYFSSIVEKMLSTYPPAMTKPSEPIAPIQPQLQQMNGHTVYWPYFTYLLPIGFICLWFNLYSSEKINLAQLIIHCFFAIFACFIITMAIRTWLQANNKKEMEYEDSVKRYNALLRQYQNDLETYPRRLEQYERTQSNPEYRQCLIRQYKRDLRLLREHPIFDKDLGTDESIKKGPAEFRLYSRLLSVFPGSCFFNSRVFIETDAVEGSFLYYPDIAIVKDGLYIDIEVDEPYIFGSSEPIHYLTDPPYNDLSIDDKRNTTLSDLGWEIIRFSEEQVVLHLEECIQFIIVFVESIVDGTLQGHLDARKNVFYLDDDEIEETIPWRQKKWTKQEALDFADCHYRDSYLCSL